MNKQVVIDNKECFDFWLNGGKVWARSPDSIISTPIWVLLSEPGWEENWTYVQDDVFVELRKVIADGEIVQWEYQEDMWADLPSDYTFGNNEVDEYRLKPKKPTFKVGQWVVCTELSNTTALPEQVVKYSNLAEGSNIFDWKLWEPKIGEFVWYGDSICKVTQVKDTESIDLGLLGGVAVNNTNLKDLVPFTGVIPEHIKGKE